MTYKDLSWKVNEAFRSLRKIGYFCKSNFYCCTTCGGAAIPSAENKKVVFWHQQDTETAKKLEKQRRTPYLYLSWAGDSVEICRHLRAAGLTVIAPDTNDTKFLVF